MAEFNKGQTILDLSATNMVGTKGKFFIALSDADDVEDEIVCFVMNTEKRMEYYHKLCNKEKGKFIIEPGTFSFIKDNTAIMLKKEVYYKFNEMFDMNIKLLDVANDLLLRQIKNCIEFKYLLEKGIELIKNSFK